MASIVMNQDGTLTVTLTAIEQQTVAGIQDDSLTQYVTLWLQEKANQVFAAQFNKLSPTQQAAVLSQFAGMVTP